MTYAAGDRPLERGPRLRHLIGGSIAACAVCCAPPLLALLGVALTGAAATAASLALAGVTFAVVVLVASLAAVIVTRRRTADPACTDARAAKDSTPVSEEACGCCEPQRRERAKA